MPYAIMRTGEAEANRVEAFSDGVLAIVITLLVLELKLPHVGGGDLAMWQAVWSIAPKIFAWVVSFVFVLVFWVAHHYFFKQLRNVDRGLLWLNGLFLLFISATPFPTGLVGDYPLARPPLVMLSAVMFLTAASFSAMRAYAAHHAVLYEDADLAAARLAYRRGLVAPALYLIGFICAFVSPYPAIGVQIAVPLLYFFPPRQAASRAAA